MRCGKHQERVIPTEREGSGWDGRRASHGHCLRSNHVFSPQAARPPPTQISNHSLQRPLALVVLERTPPRNQRQRETLQLDHHAHFFLERKGPVESVQLLFATPERRKKLGRGARWAKVRHESSPGSVRRKRVRIESSRGRSTSAPSRSAATRSRRLRVRADGSR